MRVFVTRPQSEARHWVDALRQRGFDACSLPLIEIASIADRQAIAVAWHGLGTFRAVMFVSGNAVRHFFDAKPAGAAWPPGTRAWAPGPGTRAALLDAGVSPSLVDSPAADAGQFDSESLWL